MPRIILESTAGASTASVTLRSEHLMGSRIILNRAIHSGSGYQILNGTAFTLREGAVSFPVTLTQGNYTSASFATMLATALNAAGGVNTYAAAVNNDTGLLTVTLTAGAALFSFWFTAAQQRAATILGFDVATPVPVGVILTSTYAVRLLPAYYLLKSNDLMSSSPGGGSLTGGFTTLAVLGTAGRFTPYEFTAEPDTEGFTSANTEVTVRLVDEFGTDVNLNGGVLAVDLQVSR